MPLLPRILITSISRAHFSLCSLIVTLFCSILHPVFLIPLFISKFSNSNYLKLSLSLSLVQILFHQISCLLLLTRLSCSLFFVILYQSVTLTYAIFFILSGTERAILDLNYHDLFFILTSTQEDDDG